MHQAATIQHTSFFSTGSTILVVYLLSALCVTAQTPAPEEKQKVAVPPVTTTVLVHDNVSNTYLPDTLSLGTLNSATLLEMPLSATVISRDLLNDQVSRLLTDVVKNDASIGEDYAPVGYYGDFQIRGFPIDLATGLQINGMTVAGEQDVPLENKERVEFLKGVAGVESGVASSGGLIGYVTKRPAVMKAVDLATDHRGTAFGSVDLGHFFGSEKQVGARVNMAGEHIATYVNSANGWRGVGTGAADWKINSAAMLKTDFEYQHKVERSVAGYQLLGGTVLPDIHHIYPSTMLGEQSWTKPNTFDVYNTGMRLDYNLPHAWRAFAAASFSHSLIDDNVIYPYGCGYQSACQSSGGTSLDYFFAPDGGYDIYDYRNPGELRINAQAEAILNGHVKTGFVDHELTVGGMLFRRSVQQPSESVYSYIGSENIYAPIEPVDNVDEDGVRLQAGPRIWWENNHQAALVMQDRMRLPGHIQLLASGRYNSLRDHNYSADKNTSEPLWLPQFAITYNPVDALTLYANYGVLLSLGQQAPWWVDNGNIFLDPYRTRQAEVGAKYQPGQRILLTTAFFHMRAPFFYSRVIEVTDSFCTENVNTGSPVEPGDLCFESAGHETHDGVEVNAEGKATTWLRLTASAAAIRAISDNTGTAAYDNKQVLNVPHLHTTIFADVLLPHVHGLHLMPGWGYTGRKEATRDDTVSVPAYNIFNLGARYSPGGENGHVSFRLYADNITNKRYWKDTGANYGDTFLHLGAPTTVRLAAHYTF